MPIAKAMTSMLQSGPLIREAAATGNSRVLATLLGPAYRGLIQQRGKIENATELQVAHAVHFDWKYRREFPEMQRIYTAAKRSQWDAGSDLDWSISVDPQSPQQLLIPDSYVPPSTLPIWQRLSPAERADQRHAMLSWLLSQFLHGEQGALFAACQCTEAVPWLDAKLFGGTQAVDEGRHVEAFHTYLSTKLERLYQINDNLYVIIDALITDSRWDVKFLGMQIMVEGLALGAFCSLRPGTQEPLLKEMLKLVITDEARHVHFGVLALKRFYKTELSEVERREREDWAFEVALLLRSRFLAHEFYEDYYAHLMSRAAWDQLVLRSELMELFRRTMYKRLIPNLKAIGLLSDRVRPRYAELGLLVYEGGKAAPELAANDLL